MEEERYVELCGAENDDRPAEERGRRVAEEEVVDEALRPAEGSEDHHRRRAEDHRAPDTG